MSESVEGLRRIFTSPRIPDDTRPPSHLAAWAALDEERAAHARTQGWLDRFQGAAAESALEVDKLKAELEKWKDLAYKALNRYDSAQGFLEYIIEYEYTSDTPEWQGLIVALGATRWVET